jgi:myo-inositol-1(or 4)-monophosphatase
MLTIAIRAARKAGRIITRAAEDIDSIKFARKSANDFVTEVDQAAEASVIETLIGAYPHHCILGEESGFTPAGARPGEPNDAAPDAYLSADFVWIIDPLDGTTNFIHGLPQYCVSIGLMQKGLMTQAVIYDPNRDELFSASKGGGAFLNDRRVRVSRREKLMESVIGTGFPFKELTHLDRYMADFKAMTLEGASLRRPGAAALDLAYVAAGRYDGFFETGLMPWDAAAGSLLVTEAGGLVGDYQGKPDHIKTTQMLAGSPKVFAAMVTTLAR